MVGFGIAALLIERNNLHKEIKKLKKEIKKLKSRNEHDGV